MSKKIFSIISIFLIISCTGDIEELKLLRYSDKNKSYGIEITEKEFNENDSLLFQKKKLKIFDDKNRLINENNSSFIFYNSENKIAEIKSVYRRGAKTSIVKYTYLYDKIGNLKFKIHNNDTIHYLVYSKNNQLIEEGNRFSNSKTIYKYYNNKINEKIEFENGEISQHSKFTFDLHGNKIINDWVFNTNQKMRTYYKYNEKNKIISKRDSCITVFGNPNEFVEYLTEFQYDKNDSIIEKRNLGRILSESDFKLRSKIEYKYEKL